MPISHRIVFLRVFYVGDDDDLFSGKCDVSHVSQVMTFLKFWISLVSNTPRQREFSLFIYRTARTWHLFCLRSSDHVGGLVLLDVFICR